LAGVQLHWFGQALVFDGYHNHPAVIRGRIAVGVQLGLAETMMKTIASPLVHILSAILLMRRRWAMPLMKQYIWPRYWA
jgi:hypothetical protein